MLSRNVAQRQGFPVRLSTRQRCERDEATPQRIHSHGKLSIEVHTHHSGIIWRDSSLQQECVVSSFVLRCRLACRRALLSLQNGGSSAIGRSSAGSQPFLGSVRPGSGLGPQSLGAEHRTAHGQRQHDPRCHGQVSAGPVSGSDFAEARDASVATAASTAVPEPLRCCADSSERGNTHISTGSSQMTPVTGALCESCCLVAVRNTSDEAPDSYGTFLMRTVAVSSPAAAILWASWRTGPHAWPTAYKWRAYVRKSSDVDASALPLPGEHRRGASICVPRGNSETNRAPQPQRGADTATASFVRSRQTRRPLPAVRSRRSARRPWRTTPT